MKRYVRKLTCCLGGVLLLTFSTLSWAQQPTNKEPTNKEPSSTGTSVSSPSAGTTVNAAAPSASWQNAPRKYVVQRGDTLWDISRRFLGSPWYWPKLWSKNPHIYNPHWIFPGNIINFYTSGEWKPRPTQKNKELPSISRADGRFAMADIQSSGKFGINALVGERVERRESFLDRNTIKSSGQIVSSVDERTLLSEGDRVYLKFKNRNNVRAGELYTIYRKLRSIRDPGNGRIVGYLVKLYGVLQVKEMRKKVIIAHIKKSYASIEKGFLVGPYIHNRVKLKIRRNEALVKGYVLRATTETSMSARFFQVFINRGRRHGVRVGNTFVVFRRGGIFRDRRSVSARKKHPREKIGAAVVIDARRDSCVAVVTRSKVEIQNGDEVETSLTN